MSKIIPYIVFFSVFIYCSSSDENPISGTSNSGNVNPVISTDISVSSSVNTIIWENETDLNDQLDAAITYSYGNASESDTQKTVTINSDSSLATVSISFVTSNYSDPNLSNNSITIVLEQEETSNAVVLKADGPGETYELITSVLAPGYNPIETPDCGHTEFGDHIDEIFDNILNDNVFRFFIHVDKDDDRCIKFDRQRNEIKSYSKSPDNLLAVEDETVVYKWKFKLDAEFQASANFTHLHQLKSVNDEFNSMPMITFTARGSSNQMQLRYAEFGSQTTLKSESLDLFRGKWVEVEETVEFSNPGSYVLTMKTLDGTTIFNYTNNSINMWREGADFIRPKWGIYRSLNTAEDLRDEIVLFADFSIEEL